MSLGSEIVTVALGYAKARFREGIAVPSTAVGHPAGRRDLSSGG